MASAPQLRVQSKKEGSEEREGHDYWTLRGNEDKSVLLAVRTHVAGGMELLMRKRTHDGDYKSKK